VAEISAMLHKMGAADYELAPALGLSAPCVALLRRMLEPDPDARISTEGILAVGPAARMRVGLRSGLFALQCRQRLAPTRREEAAARARPARSRPGQPRLNPAFSVRSPRTPGSSRACRPTPSP
jgi:hypothetical protein